MMDDKYELLELYKEFVYTKENFVDRSFATNKFYIIAVTLCLVAIAVVKEFVSVSASWTVVSIALTGMTFSLLLWANQDAYAYLLRVKFAAVIDKIEEKLCIKPCMMEKEAIHDQAKKRKNYVFADVQKSFALTALAIFLAIFLWDFVQKIMMLELWAI